MICSSKSTLYFKDLIESLSEIVSRANFVFTKDGVSLIATDTVQVIYAHLEIHKNFFHQYELSQESLEVSLNMQHLLTVFRCGRKDDSFKMKFDTPRNQLHIEFISAQGVRSASFILNVLESLN